MHLKILGYFPPCRWQNPSFFQILLLYSRPWKHRRYRANRDSQTPSLLRNLSYNFDSFTTGAEDSVGERERLIPTSGVRFQKAVPRPGTVWGLWLDSIILRVFSKLNEPKQRLQRGTHHLFVFWQAGRWRFSFNVCTRAIAHLHGKIKKGT